MLNEGNRRKQRGTDVVVGFIECHGRPQTEKLIADLELVPRRAVEYRGSSFTEMDVDAVIRRNPQVALVDELAHTNVPGSGRNEKRWQDVVELLDAGVDVISAVNIQHLESIADAVEQITEVPIREHSRKEVGPMKKGKAPAKKAPADRAKVVKTKVAKPAKLSHRPKP
jgi:two-component system sensor histidine kinase KdpD